jgi:cysteine synthase/rhodanese-related sulfurtransferase
MHNTDSEKVRNVFTGETAVLDFLDPDKAPYTPLVEIPSHLNPYRKNGVRIYAKLMNTLPLTNVKSLPALNMLLEAKHKGVLENVDTVIENSSGNTVLSLAVIARILGIPTTKAVVSHEVSVGKLNLLRFLGTEIIVNEEPICPDPNDKTSGIYKAKQWAEEKHWFNPGQYDNEDNPNAHYKWTGPQIWDQTNGDIHMLTVGLGTTGTVVGLGHYLKEQKPELTIIGVARKANNPIPGPRTSNLLKQIAFDWSVFVDHQEEVGTTQSFQLSLDLCRAGLLVGPSSGFALGGLLNHLQKQDLSDGKERVAVFVCPDSPLPYIDDYFTYLNKDSFPSIENEHLLKNRGFATPQEAATAVVEIQEVTPQEAFSMLYTETPEEMWSMVDSQEKVTPKQGFSVVDVRDKNQYEDHHVPGAVNVPFDSLNDFLAENESALKERSGVLFVCLRGVKSQIAAHEAEKRGIRSYSLKGGDIEWSNLHLPRTRPNKCIVRYDLDH